MRQSEGASTAPSEASPQRQDCAGGAGARTEVSQSVLAAQLTFSTDDVVAYWEMNR